MKAHCRLIISRFLLAAIMYCGSIALHLPHLIAQDLTSMDLESLMQLEVTSVSRKEERVMEAAAAIYVITADDIARSPATVIPELLRMVPGLQVAQIDTGQWAITARGYNSPFANKLLVMIDGRSIYTPLFSGVFWDSKDLLLEDIERIEVIRGPGAVMWGANAVNGIINIITKSAFDTTGGFATGLGGNKQEGSGSLRYGERIGEHGAGRVYAKYRNLDSNELVDSNEDSYSDLEDVRGGFRYDYDDTRDQLMVSGELMRGIVQNSVIETISFPPSMTEQNEPGDYSGGNILAHWQRRFEKGDALSMQFFFDRESRDDLLLESKVDILDYEANYHFDVGNRHRVIVGGNYRWMGDDLDSSPALSFSEDTRSISRASVFVQDEIALIEETLVLTIGAKLEYHDYVGLEPQPNIRASWHINPRHTLWAATSYASRIPSRAENDVYAPQGISTSATGDSVNVLSAFGDVGIDSEHVTSVELGYRGELNSWLSVDVASYYNHYSDVASVAPGMPNVLGLTGGLPVIELPLNFSNSGEADSFGLELASTLALTSWSNAQLGATLMHIDYDYGSGSEGSGGGAQGTDPRHQMFTRLTLRPLDSFDIIAQARYVDSLPAFDIDAYIEGDMRLAYRPSEAIEISLNGTNLFNASHREYVSQGIFSAPVSIERSMWAQLRVWF